jgi:hypothetical protein
MSAIVSDVIAPEASASAVSWPAVFAGGVTAAAMSVILVLLGSGLGLASVSPWAGAGVSATTFTVLAAIWLIIVQWVSAIFGGYMAGRLRIKWTGLHTDDVFFRNTAHGFLAWALGTLIVVALVAGASGSVAGTGARVAASSTAMTTASDYEVDELFRVNAGGSALGNAAPGAPDPHVREQAKTILAEGALNGAVPAADSAYLAQLVSANTGLAPADAQARVSDVLAQAEAAEVKVKQAADAARKAASGAAIYTFISLLIGAFIASVAGAIGGRLRDHY